MIRYHCQQQRTIAAFDWPFPTALDEARQFSEQIIDRLYQASGKRVIVVPVEHVMDKFIFSSKTATVSLWSRVALPLLPLVVSISYKTTFFNLTRLIHESLRSLCLSEPAARRQAELCSQRVCK
ncbi:MAG TPA: hypothetical protein ENI62_11810 [Gammaproteobacteria bacterium]|nr:hypothetical protein [Gammaproteobacteria bacterium]